MVPVIAYFGPPGTFTEMALDAVLAAHQPDAVLDLSGEIDRVAASSPAATIAMIRSGEADYGCVPIESSMEGSVPATMDALVPSTSDAAIGRVQAFAETVLDISFAIAAVTPLPPRTRSAPSPPIPLRPRRCVVGWVSFSRMPSS